MSAHRRIALHTFAIAVSAAFVVAACGGDDVDSNQPPSVVAQLPAAPADPDFVDSAPVQASVPAFVDNTATNQRGDARYATMSMNAGVRVLNGFRALWQPLTDLVDAGTSAPAAGGFPAVAPSLWTGLPNDGTPGGTALNQAVLNANVQYVVDATSQRTAAQAEAAYYDDRRGKGYSVSDGMGPLTDAWRGAADDEHHVGAGRRDDEALQRYGQQHRRRRQREYRVRFRRRFHQYDGKQRLDGAGETLLQICASVSVEHERRRRADARTGRKHHAGHGRRFSERAFRGRHA